MAPKDVALALLATFDPLDIAANIALRTPDCIWQMAPGSLGFPPDGMDNKAHEAHLNGIKAVLERFPVTPKEVWEGKGDKGWVVTVWATSEAIFRESVKDDDLDWTFLNEYVFVFEFDESGEKIKRIIEMLDSVRVKDVQILLARAKENLAKKGQA